MVHSVTCLVPTGPSPQPTLKAMREKAKTRTSRVSVLISSDNSRKDNRLSRFARGAWPGSMCLVPFRYGSRTILLSVHRWSPEVLHTEKLFATSTRIVFLVSPAPRQLLQRSNFRTHVLAWHIPRYECRSCCTLASARITASLSCIHAT
jgi:hypothetical protein